MKIEIRMKKGDYLTRVEEETYYLLRCVDVVESESSEEEFGIGDAVYLYYEIFDEGVPLGKIRELCSLHLSERFKLYDRYCSFMGIETSIDREERKTRGSANKEIKEGEVVNINDCMNKWMSAFLVNNQGEDVEFLSIRDTQPYDGMTPDVEEIETETEEESESIGADTITCPECGETEIPPDAETCPDCGAEIETEGVEEETETGEEICAWCKISKPGKSMVEIDGKFYHHGIGSCRIQYLRDKKKKEKKNVKRRKGKQSVKDEAPALSETIRRKVARKIGGRELVDKLLENPEDIGKLMDRAKEMTLKEAREFIETEME